MSKVLSCTSQSYEQVQVQCPVSYYTTHYTTGSHYTTHYTTASHYTTHYTTGSVLADCQCKVDCDLYTVHGVQCTQYRDRVHSAHCTLHSEDCGQFSVQLYVHCRLAVCHGRHEELVIDV